MPIDTASPLRPLLKWAGGKRQLLPTLRNFYPEKFTRYVEPFVGSGAVFFDLHAAGRIYGKRVCLADSNPDLVGCYQQVRDQPDAVVTALEALADGHQHGGKTFYYDVRNNRFNPTRTAGGPYTPELAAMFIYLNRTGYNGLFRVNRRGWFNVPVGRYANPTICNASLIRMVSAALRDPGISLECQPFETPLSQTGEGDFVYCDPPYAPLSDTARFAHYTREGFSATDQARLQEAIVAAVSRGATVVMSNSSTPETERLYQSPAARTAGLLMYRVAARRAINSLGNGRGPIDELIITNAGLTRSPVRHMLKVKLNGAVRRPA
jgi:DNA adenine methylase